MRIRLPPSEMSKPPAFRDARESLTPPSDKVTSLLDPSKKLFRFLDLPPELRNRVYSELLEAHGPIHIVRVKDHKNCEEPKWNGREYCGCSPDHYRSQKHKKDSSLNPKILRVNRQVLAEAAPILYGNNIFKFQEDSSFDRFLYQIGYSQYSNTYRLRHVECYGIVDEDWVVLPRVDCAWKLKTLVLTISDRRTPEKDEKLVECIKDLFEGMHRGQQIHIHFKDPNAVERNLVDMLRLIPESIGKRWWDHDIKEEHSPEMETPEGQFAKDLEDKMKEEVTRGFVEKDVGYQGCLLPLS